MCYTVRKQSNLSGYQKKFVFEMARCLRLPYVCISIFLLVSPLECSNDEEKDGIEVRELLQRLSKAEKERRTMQDDVMADGSEGLTNDDKNGLKVIKKTDKTNENTVDKDGETKMKTIQDCDNKYELIMDKDAGECFLHKMSDKIYQKNCQGIGNEEQIDVKFELGSKIEDTQPLANIKGIDGCMGKPIYNLKQISETRRKLDEYEKRLVEGKGCSYCNVYETVCNWVCGEKQGWWWGEHCVRNVYDCQYKCKYDCR